MGDRLADLKPVHLGLEDALVLGDFQDFDILRITGGDNFLIGYRALNVVSAGSGGRVLNGQVFLNNWLPNAKLRVI